MELEDFKSSLGGQNAPEDASPYLKALWHEKHGDWKSAHEIVQELNDGSAAWVHAYLHRREGDEGNAAYWYGQADRPFPAITLEEEWEELVAALI